MDLVSLRYAMRVNGVTEICLTKLDVLDELKHIHVCTEYKLNQGTVLDYPLDLNILSTCEPVYDTLPGWMEDISEVTCYDDLPLNARNYVKYVSQILSIPITMISVGSRRSQTIHLMEL